MKRTASPQALAHGFLDELLTSRAEKRPYSWEKAQARALSYGDYEEAREYGKYGHLLPEAK